jgi:hypothetical protein
MLEDNDKNMLVVLLREYPIKEILSALASVADDQAGEYVDMQLADKAQELSYAAEDLNNLADSLGQG